MDEAPAALTSSNSNSNTAMVTGVDFPVSAANAGENIAMANRTPAHRIAANMRFIFLNTVILPLATHADILPAD